MVKLSISSNEWKGICGAGKDRQGEKDRNEPDPHHCSIAALALFTFLLFHPRTRRSFVNLFNTSGLPLFMIMLSSILTPNLFSIYMPGSRSEEHTSEIHS